MTDDHDLSGQNQTRTGLVFLVTGVILMLWTWGSWLYRSSEPAILAGIAAPGADATTPASAPAVDRIYGYGILGLALLLLAALLGYFVFRARLTPDESNLRNRRDAT